MEIAQYAGIVFKYQFQNEGPDFSMLDPVGHEAFASIIIFSVIILTETTLSNVEKMLPGSVCAKGC